MQRAIGHRDPSFQIASAIWLASMLALFSSASADLGALDAGELGGAAWSLGVPHPTGFPLDMLLLRWAALLPLGPIAFRQNIGVGLIAASAIAALALLSVRLARRSGCRSPAALVGAACVSAAALLGSRTFLDAALSVEVYVTALLCVCISACLLDATDTSRRRLAWPVIGLATGAHVTAPLLLCPIVVASWIRGRERFLRSLLPQLICALAGMIVLAYVPLAALRDTAFDWGDPQTLARWFRHITAARIREAYAASLFAGAQLPRLLLIEQLTEHAYWLPLTALGVVHCVRAARRLTLLLLLVLSFDLGYAVWVNPMGIEQRQVGHASLAVIALLAGCGCAAIVERLSAWRPRAGGLAGVLGVTACAVSVTFTLAHTDATDGYVVSERFGAGSPLQDLPPRSLYVCETDSACASAMFALYAEGTRPDLDVVPAQHLWDPTVLRRLRGLPLASKSNAAWPAAAQRAELARAHRGALLSLGPTRPMYMEQIDHMGHAEHSQASDIDLDHVPLLGMSPRPSASAADASTRLERLEHARFGDSGPISSQARSIWASAHETLGAVYLRQGRTRAAVEELARAVALTPLRAVAASNLGVALEHQGELGRALEQTARAIELEPRRPTPWVNLTRLLLRVEGPQAARAALVEARRLEVRDPRLDQLTRSLEPDQAAR